MKLPSSLTEVRKAADPYLAQAGSMGHTVAATTVAGAQTVRDVAGAISNIPWYIAVPGTAAIAMAAGFGGSKQQSTPTGPSFSGTNPGAYNSRSSLSDMGASGDLVFALHNLNH